MIENKNKNQNLTTCLFMHIILFILNSNRVGKPFKSPMEFQTFRLKPYESKTLSGRVSISSFFLFFFKCVKTYGGIENQVADCV